MIIIMFAVSMMTKDIKLKTRNERTNTVILTIVSIIVFLMIVFLTFTYFNTSTNFDEFNIIEKVYEEKGISIYTIFKGEEEKYLMLKGDGIFNKVFLHIKAPVQNLVETHIATFKYTHYIVIENSIIMYTLKNCGDGVLSFWLALAIGIATPQGMKSYQKQIK